jgi:hypothetical protein
MSGDAELVRDEEINEQSGFALTRSDFVERFGAAAGEELFGRIDERYRSGNTVFCTSVRAARESLRAARTPGRARLVVPARTPRGEGEALEGMVMIAMSDFEAVVKAGQPGVDWLAEFSPRPGLAAATTRPSVPRGVVGHRMFRP